jgi:selenocysteine-specific elongation factor
LQTGKKTVRAVFGTAGHIDHGKTTLVRGLTGIETDRLQQEKERGISIELGFAYMDGPKGRVGIVDCPGHERFVRQMIAGAAGIDLVLLIVAADEGVMPQTIEHLDICSLLGVSKGAIVVTKCDLVDDEWLELVEDDIREAVAGTFLGEAPMLRYAANDAERTAKLKDDLDALVDAGGFVQRGVDRPFKLSVDRAFTMKGFGTVVTGTSMSGELSLGDRVVLLPEGRETRVRGLQVHGEQVDSVPPGVRAAINLQGVEYGHVSRGDVIVRHGQLQGTHAFDASLTALARLSKPIKDRSKVLVHIGTAQIQATVVMIGQSTVEPGQQVPVQIRLDHPTAVLPGEPFIIRGFEVLERYGKTLGGGRAWMPSLRYHRRRSRDAAELILGIASNSPDEMLTQLATFVGADGLEVSTLPFILPLTGATIKARLAELRKSDQLVGTDKRLYSRSFIESMRDTAFEVVDAFHVEQPARAGIPLEELRSRVASDVSQDIFQNMLGTLTVSGRMALRGDRVARADFTPKRSPEQDRACQAILEAIQAGGLMPPRLQDLSDIVTLSKNEVQGAIDLLLDSGEAIRVSRELIYAAGPLNTLQSQIVTLLQSQEQLDTAGLKELTGASRKWTIPIGEYFDRIKLTIRVGDSRRLR